PGRERHGPRTGDSARAGTQSRGCSGCLVHDQVAEHVRHPLTDTRSAMAESTRTRSPEEAALLERARKRLPGGVLGASRYAEEAAFVVRHGKGSKIYDVSGREYIDYVLASGPLILGHAHPAVVAAVRAQIEGGSTYFMVNEPIIELAEEICRAVPCAEQVRFTSTGSEATFFALRTARTARQRDK